MSDLTSATYSLVRGDLVRVRVQASNAKGWGDLSDVNTIGSTVESVPDQMTIPTRGALTSGTAVQVLWSALTSGSSAAGGATATIISYHLQWDAGNSASTTWLDLQGLSPTSTATSFLRTSGITGGLTYRFRVRARNKYGFG